MDWTLVKNRRGRRAVCWGTFLKMTLILLAIPAGAASGIYVLMTKRWNPIALYGGLAAGALTAIVILIVALAVPIFKLPYDKEGRGH